ncbi:MAG: hypothetical protein P1U39_01495 [Legionellaceae bacterium]|nr:hypothetical protein [Legionellaceae bacterium]
MLQSVINIGTDAHSVSQHVAYTQETVDSGTKNKLWSFRAIHWLANLSLFPLLGLFPALYVWLVYVGTALLLGAIFYLASVAHHNQIAENLAESNAIISLPWEFHKNTYFMRIARFLSDNLVYPLLALYGISLVACVFMGSPWYACIAVAMFALDQLYQREYLPDFLDMPYLCLSVTMLLLVVFGVTSYIALGLSLAMIAFTVIDHILYYKLGKISPTVQFPKSQVLEVDATEVAQPLETVLKAYQTARADLELHVTIDHFSESFQLVDNILQNVPSVNYQRYLTLFDAIDFENVDVQEQMLCQMYLHDKFNGQDLQGLSQDELMARQKDYLRQEMVVFVKRLEQKSHRDLTHLQAANMHGYARLLLLNMEHYSAEDQASLLLAIAMTTGSHCYRSYPENLSTFAAEKELLFKPNLTLREHALLAVQDIREAAFRTYYYDTVRKLIKYKKYKPYNPFWTDVDDYFTYEDFVYWFGLNFYLRNVSFTMGIRDASEVLWDRMIAFMFREHEYKLLFCETYDVKYLIDRAIDPKEKLYLIFWEWCAERDVHIVQLDDDLMPIQRNEDELRALAELMLLDFNIVDVKTPTVSRHALFQPAPWVVDEDEAFSCGYDT